MSAPPEQISKRAALPDWLFAGGAALLWLAIRNASFSDLPVSLAVDLLLVLIVGSVVLSFERGDPPRLGWALATLTFTFAGWGSAWRDQPFAADYAEYWGHVYLGVNVCWAATIMVFARNLLGISLRPRWTLPSLGVVGACATFALVICGLLLNDIAGAWQGFGDNPTTAQIGDTLVGASSAVADALVFIGAVLIARVVLPMAGGAVARPYLLLSASAAMYLVLDVVTFISADFWTLTGQIVFSLGEALLVAAAVSQVQLLRSRR